MTGRTSRAAILLGSLLLVACAVTAPHITYLQLSADDATRGSGPGPALYIEPVQLPDFLLRDALLMRIDEHRLDYRQTQRWAEPLDLGIQRVVAAQLAAQFDTPAVGRYPAPRPTGPHWRIALEVAHFESNPDGLHLEVNASLTAVDGAGNRTDSTPLRTRIERRHANVPNDAAVIAATMSAMLGELSAELATTLRDAQREAPEAAPPDDRVAP